MDHHEEARHGQELSTTPSAAEIEAGRRLFAQECRFFAAAQRLAELPQGRLPEVAFAGRSNVGKSSLLNALVGRRTLARTSHTPGRTRQLNFFELGRRLVLVDMPGYGYAKAPKHMIAAWTGLVRDYLRGRVELRRLCLLVDGRHGLKPSDRELMDLLESAAVAYQIVLTKTDKVGTAAVERRLAGIERELAKRKAAMPRVVATSARTGRGVAELRAALATLASEDPLR